MGKAALTGGFLLLAAAIVVVSFSSSQDVQELESIDDTQWTPAMDSASSRFFSTLQKNLDSSKATSQKQQLMDTDEGAVTDALQVAPPQPDQIARHHEQIRGVIRPYGRLRSAAGIQELADVDGENQMMLHKDARRAHHDSKADDSIFNFAEQELKGSDNGPLGPLSRGSKEKSITIAELEKKIAADKKREQEDSLALSRVASKTLLAATRISALKKKGIAAAAAKYNNPHASKKDIAAAARALQKSQLATKKSSIKKSSKKSTTQSEIQKTAALMKNVAKLLGKRVPRHAYQRPLSTALVARELGQAVDRHEHCRRQLEVAEHTLMAIEEKAKTAMREAREADAGMAKSLRMVKKAEDLVEKAREEHENYVQDVRDSLDIRSQYTTRALAAHTLLEHMNRLKGRYERAVQALARDQVKYNKLLRRIENDTDKKADLKQTVEDEKEELMVVGETHDHDDAGISLAESNPREQKLADEPFEETDKIMDSIDPSLHKRQSRIQQLRSRAQMLSSKAKQVMQTLPMIEQEARKEKRRIHFDNQLLVEAENDRVLTKNRIDEGDLTPAMHQHLQEMVERDQQQIVKLRLDLQRARAQLRGARRAETMGPALAHEAGDAQREAHKQASQSVASEFQHGFSMFGLGSFLASAVPPTLAKTVADEVMRMSVSTSKLKMRVAKNSQSLAAANTDLVNSRAQARQLRSEMEIKREIANDARKDYQIARNQYEHAERRVQPLEAELHDRSKGVLESRQNAEVALQKAQQHLVSTRRTARFAAIAKRKADRYLRRIRKTLFDKQEVVKNLQSCQRGSWDKIKDLTDNAKLRSMIGDGDSDLDWTSPKDLMRSAA